MNIIHNISIKTTPERLFEAVTTQKGIAGWWAPKTKAEPEVGGLVEPTFGPGQTVSFRVEKLEPARQVVWSAVHVPPDWKGTRVTFDITPTKGAMVEFTFTQSGFPSPYEEFGFFNFMWGQYIRSIKLLLETGTGEPFGTPASKSWHPLGE